MPDTGSPSYEHVVPNLPESEGREGGERGGMKSKGKGEGWKEGVGERERRREAREKERGGGGGGTDKLAPTNLCQSANGK